MPENDHSKNAQIEEKLVGLLLGELNAEEKRMVEELCVKDVAWAKRRGELQNLFELLPMALDEEREIAADAEIGEWRMAPNRRGLLTGILSRQSSAAASRLRVWIRRGALVGAAAAVLVLFGGLGLVGFDLLVPSKDGQRFSYRFLPGLGDAEVFEAAMPAMESAGGYDESGYSYGEVAELGQWRGEVAPSAPDSSAAGLITSTTSSGKVAEPNVSPQSRSVYSPTIDEAWGDGRRLEIGSGMDLGDGFGGGGAGGGSMDGDDGIAAFPVTPATPVGGLQSGRMGVVLETEVVGDTFAAVAPPAVAAAPAAVMEGEDPGKRDGGFLGVDPFAGPGGGEEATNGMAIRRRGDGEEFEGHVQLGSPIDAGLRSGDVVIPREAIDRLYELEEEAPDEKKDLEDDMEAAEAERRALREFALERLEQVAARQPVSTFSLDVGDVSFQLARRAFENNERPDPEQVRTEDFLNAFDYGDPSPQGGVPVAVVTEQAVHPFQQERNLVRVSLRTAASGRVPQKPLNLTLVLDNSGSMERADRKETVDRMMVELSALLGERDTISLLSFSRRPRLVMHRVSGEGVGQLPEVVAQLPVEGGTNIEEALRLGNQVALDKFGEDAGNRLVLITDGAANLGEDDPDVLAGKVRNLRQQGIGLDIFGVGADGLNDALLHTLAQVGDGRYRILNDPEVDGGNFARILAGAFHPQARDVKIQVEFNPQRVGNYRLLGYERSILREEDFRDDRVQAGELAADENGVALYSVEVLPEGSGEIGTVRVRFQDVADGVVKEMSWAIPYQPRAPEIGEAQPGMRLAASAGFLAELLQGGAWGELVDGDRLRQLAVTLREELAGSENVGHLVDMIDAVSRDGR